MHSSKKFSQNISHKRCYYRRQPKRAELRLPSPSTPQKISTLFQSHNRLHKFTKNIKRILIFYKNRKYISKLCQPRTYLSPNFKKHLTIHFLISNNFGKNFTEIIKLKSAQFFFKKNIFRNKRFNNQTLKLLSTRKCKGEKETQKKRKNKRQDQKKKVQILEGLTLMDCLQDKSNEC